MPPAPEGDGSSLQDTKIGGSLASVLKGLAGAKKLTKLPIGSSMPSTHAASSAVVAQIAQQLKTSAPVPHGVPQQYVQALNQLKNGLSVNDRVSAAAALRQAIVDYPLNPVLDIWYAAKDLVEPPNSDSTRAGGWELLIACVRHPYSTALERKEFFQTVSSVTAIQDFRFQLSALVELTREGRNVSGFDYEVFPLVSTWLVSAFDTVRSARSSAKKSGSRAKGKNNLLPEEENFSDLFKFIKDLIKFNIGAANEEAVEALVDSLLKICMAASVEDDLRACIDVLESIVTYGAIPQQRHKNCVQVLSSIHCLVPSLEKASWHTFRVLCRSHNGAATIRQLVEVLKAAEEEPEKLETKKQTTREVRGAISILQKLVAKSSEKGYPAIPFTLLVDGLENASSTSSWRIQLDILRLLNTLFDGEGADVNATLCDEDWAPLFQVAIDCASIAIKPSSKEEPAKSQTTREDSLTSEIAITVEVLKLVSRIEMVISNSPSPLLQREDCIEFLAKLHHLLPDSAALAVLDYYKEFRCCFPSDVDWETKLESVLHDFFSDKGRSTEVRSKALQIVTELYDMIELIDDHIEPEFVPELVRRLLAGVSEESDSFLLDELVSFSCAVAATANYDLFLAIIDTLRGVIGGERLRAPVELDSLSSASSSTQDTARGPTHSTPSNVVVKGYVKLFVSAMGHDSAKAIYLYEALVSIAKLESCEIDARLSAMKLLFRLRADWANRIFIIYDTESSTLAATLVRTEAALLRKQAEESSQPNRHAKPDGSATVRPTRGASFSQLHPSDRLQTTRSSSGVRPSPSHYHQLWMLPDPEALPPNASQLASSVLFCSSKDNVPADQESGPEAQVLHASTWLEAILDLLKEGSDWEIFSFMLVHLPSQLSNHALFKSAIPQMQELRRTVCEQLRANSLPEPPNAHGLRRADVAISYFQSLTMILSYHHHFNKPEEDDIVRTFVQGIAHWERSAKTCIHALSICCHELPSSTSKMLVTMLSKMSQIITQPYVAMHILEFLTCLSRLPELYANFHQEEFRIVFGICFRYLQYAREKRQAHKVSMQGESHAALTIHSERTNPNAADDLPQYVYALAYHVIIFWFMALKLPDRPTHVGWIAKNLFMDAEGAQASDELAQTTIDFMQRVTYADVVESAADPLFTPERFGPINKRRWLVGNSIVTIEQATTSGWAQITKRHPSGTSSYMIRENFQQPPPHQKGLADIGRDESAALANVILPNHLLVSLLTSLPQGHDHTRPIPLPNDDVVQRAIRLFDHNSTVDGHKVGIIYIGENQTKESDILANVSGSSDYVEFLNRLGTLTKLKGATFNTQGLDRQYGTDGEYAFCWRDRVTEMVFHVTTQMPTNIEHDPLCTLKKRHIGNDFVNIIFNDSGSPFRFNTFPSDFNYVNIVITPESRGSFVATRQQSASEVPQISFYKVQVMSKPGFPEISPASDTKIVSLKALPAFIRLLALNASVFSLVWSTRESGGDNISSWRNRLREIVRLRDKFGLKASTAVNSASSAPSPPGTSHFGSQPGAHGFHGSHPLAPPSHDTLRMGNSMRESFSSLRRSSVATFFTSNSDHPPQQASQRSSLASTTHSDTTEVNNFNGTESVVDSVDFSKWA